MIDFKEISINDKFIFDKYLDLYNPDISELTFTNIFMWRNFYKFRFTVIFDCLCLISVPEKGDPFAFMPIGIVKEDTFLEVFHGLKEYFSKNGWKLTFKRVQDKELPYLDKLNDEKETVFDRDNSDYVYRTEDLAMLKGKKYDGKRNHINKFNKQYTFEYIAIQSNNIDACSRIMAEWCAERNCEDHRELYCEKLANRELLDNYEALKLKGALIKVNDVFQAFTVGERLNKETAVVHIEKANGNVSGLYTLINQQFCDKDLSDTIYVNREQDLGIEGLRKAKTSYHPVKIIHKYSVFIK